MDLWTSLGELLNTNGERMLLKGVGEDNAPDSLLTIDNFLGDSLMEKVESERTGEEKRGKIELGKEDDAEGLDGDTRMNANTNE